ncbi:MAG TPA: hypothetical protein VGU61_00145 [Noviherbaspirillum sp.]|jgi:hypothetical protein|uniref:hypothetical protein n=1 Tax=Noviherbaspirillum sp. TaxID=1926288 RepID=UPI002DDCB1EC|nr:hypothetical protein [Noviherbaspirillum sp.]HEV2608646.1 hypothetical protein [Noviherbaspirillum sp.]
MPIAAVLALLFGSGPAAAAAHDAFGCDGALEKQAWALWDKEIHGFLSNRLIKERLSTRGDTAALYDFQTYTYNLASMARRCKRTARLMEMARIVHTAYGALEPVSLATSSKWWICRDGPLCHEKAPLHNREVMLHSVQFLGLASYLANAIATSNAPLGAEEQRYINDTVSIAIDHLSRWGNESAIDKVAKAIKATPQDVKNGSTALLFTDKPLWMITIYAEIAGILDAQGRLGFAIRPADKQQIEPLRKHLSTLLAFFSARVSYHPVKNSKTPAADLDRGFWRNYADGRYAGYEKEEKPAECPPPGDTNAEARAVIRIPAHTVPMRSDTGWDISHARRLVPALDALERNRDAIARVFSVSRDALPSNQLPEAFATALYSVLWNQDPNRPLFSNYWSGANGWYRVAYEGDKRKCREGHPPYGMTASFPTSGYVTWARYKPAIGTLGRTLYEVIKSEQEADIAFIEKYYPMFGRSADTQKRALAEVMFFPSLIAN